MRSRIVEMSCPCCGARQHLAALVFTALRSLDVPHRCGQCGQQSPLLEWADRMLGPLPEPKEEPAP